MKKKTPSGNVVDKRVDEWEVGVHVRPIGVLLAITCAHHSTPGKRNGQFLSLVLMPGQALELSRAMKRAAMSAIETAAGQPATP